jgi:hypothetical protein
MSAATVQIKRGRKAKTVEFKKRTDTGDIDNFEIRQTYILHIPIKLDILLKNCSINNNESTFDIQSIYKDIPENISAYNDNHCIVQENKQMLINIQEKKKIAFEPPQEYTENDKKGNSANIKVYNNIILPVSDEPDKIKQITATKTNVACWWCCHTFDTYPICAPVKYDERKDLFSVVGCFCSFNCSKSYINSEMKTKSHLISFLAKRLSNQLENIKASPPRTVLKMFGGPLSIEEYRQTFKTLDIVKINVFPMVFFPMQIEYHKVTELAKGNIDKISAGKSKKGTLSRKSVDRASERITSNTVVNNSENSLVNLMNIKIRE